MKIIYFGSDVFLPCFEYFLQNHEILALYTYHNDEDYFSEYTITRLAAQNGIPVHYESITPDDITAFFAGQGCELLFCAEYNRIISLPENLPSFRGINVHSSLLPEGRSYYPIEAAMERGLTRTGVTLHKMEPQLDRGAVLAQKEFPIAADMDSIDVYLTSSEKARLLLEEMMRDFDAAWAAARVQTEVLPYWKRPASSLLSLRHDMTAAQAQEVFRKYNAMTEVTAGNGQYYVRGLSVSRKSLAREILLSPTLLLYPVKDGHLRLTLRQMEDKGK